jgi:hypothetical protein
MRGSRVGGAECVTVELSGDPELAEPVGGGSEERTVIKWIPEPRPLESKSELRACPTCFPVEFQAGRLLAKRPYIGGDVTIHQITCPRCDAMLEADADLQFVRCPACTCLVLIVPR